MVPDAEEALKWSAPAWLKDGKILLIAASFKAHAAVNFWRGKEMGLADDDAMGQLGKLATVGDLPANFDDLILKAVQRSAYEAPKKAKPAPKAIPEIHPAFADALAANPAARATLEGLSPSARRDYLDWVNDAKRDDTRDKRIATAVEWLAQGKKRHWKYENC